MTSQVLTLPHSLFYSLLSSHNLAMLALLLPAPIQIKKIFVLDFLSCQEWVHFLSKPLKPPSKFAVLVLFSRESNVVENISNTSIDAWLPFCPYSVNHAPKVWFFYLCFSGFALWGFYHQYIAYCQMENTFETHWIFVSLQQKCVEPPHKINLNDFLMND